MGRMGQGLVGCHEDFGFHSVKGSNGGFLSRGGV